jgi:hypothetical protein
LENDGVETFFQPGRIPVNFGHSLSETKFNQEIFSNFVMTLSVIRHWITISLGSGQFVWEYVARRHGQNSWKNGPGNFDGSEGNFTSAGWQGYSEI